MTDRVHSGLSFILPEVLKNYVALIATPRVVERERQLLEHLDHALSVFASEIEQEVRRVDKQMPGVLDSEDVRLALGDLRSRRAHLAASFERDVPGVEALHEFIATAADLGKGGVKAAQSADEVADAVSRAIDHVEGYMLGRGHVLEETLCARLEPAGVRKFGTVVSGCDVAIWRHTRVESLVEMRKVDVGRHPGRAMIA